MYNFYYGNTTLLFSHLWLHDSYVKFDDT